MKQLIAVVAMATMVFGCKEKAPKDTFTLNGTLKNAENQKVYIDQLYFSDKNPEVLDTADVVNGKFSFTVKGSEEGLYRLRLEKQDAGYIFINDATTIDFTADVKDMSLQGPQFNTKANKLFQNFLINIDQKQRNLNTLGAAIDTLQKQKNTDSLVNAKSVALNAQINDFKNFVIKSIDTASDPVVAMFALGYTRGIDPNELKTVIPNMVKRFPNNQAVVTIINQYNQLIAKQNTPATTSGKPSVGMQAPDFSMADVNGKPISLSSLKGKYVLIDFWASWCGPCRGENPNVVANYNKFKDKNFTILGVSLDEDKAAWQKAIAADKLTWTHISDLKGWASPAVPLYGFDGIPYNVLIDPQGKIIATELRGDALGNTLSKLLK
ncbi:redoxin domain-containing protein [Ferruginibacter yonginensis]|uniref:Redoxin domain-containing protein n=1 Tax=Ferruginibacter yonginensis TaxID=1310416 RepID=A0ABV8QWB8_9BACT